MADDGAGGVELVVAADAPEEVQREVAQAIEPIVPGSVESVERFIEQARAARSPAERGVVFQVPRLSIELAQGELELAEPESFIDLAGWDLLARPDDAWLDSFNYTETGEGFAFDVDGDTLVYRSIDEEIALALDERTEWDAAALSRFIDRQTRQIHTAQPVYLEFCRRVVTDLIERRGMSLAALVRGKFALQKAVVAHVEALRAQTARRGVRMFLAGEVAADFTQAPPFAFQPSFYNVTSFHDGPFRPNRHFYARMGKMNALEVRCATVIDRMAEVETWVRNGERAPGNYALAYSSGHFFPDFVAKLHDGRVFLIEAKGRTDDRDREKDNVGRRVAEASAGRLLYVTVWEDQERERSIEDQIRSVL
jgi:type III restriction enzyme